MEIERKSKFCVGRGFPVSHECCHFYNSGLSKIRAALARLGKYWRESTVFALLGASLFSCRKFEYLFPPCFDSPLWTIPPRTVRLDPHNGRHHEKITSSFLRAPRFCGGFASAGGGCPRDARARFDRRGLQQRPARIQPARRRSLRDGLRRPRKIPRSHA